MKKLILLACMGFVSLHGMNETLPNVEQKLVTLQNLQNEIQKSHAYSVAIHLKKLELSTEERQTLLPELLEKAADIKKKQKKNLSLLNPSWDSAKFFGGLGLAAVSASEIIRRLTLGSSQSYTTCSLLGGLGLYYAYRGTQYIYQKKCIKAANDIETLLTNALHNKTDKTPMVLNEQWYKHLGSPGIGLIVGTAGIGVEAFKGNRLAAGGLLTMAGAIIVEQGIQQCKDCYHSSEIFNKEWDVPSLIEQLTKAVEASNPASAQALLEELDKTTIDVHEKKELLSLLSNKASHILELRKDQLLLPRTFADKVRMAGGTTVALLGLCVREFTGIKTVGILASCLGLYEGYHGLRRSSQRDSYLQAQRVTNIITKAVEAII